MTTFWNHPAWLAYEHAYGEEPGTRAELLANAAWKTRIVDLHEPTRLRKSYRSLVNGIVSGRTGVVIQPRIQGCDIKPAMEEARLLHINAAGGETRSRDTWMHMAEWAYDSAGVLVSAGRSSGMMVGFAYFVRHGNWAYYFSAVGEEPDIGLALIWSGMNVLRAQGVRWCELGWIGAAVNDKERDIEFVKRGFGGRDVPVAWSGRSLTDDEWEAGRG